MSRSRRPADVSYLGYDRCGLGVLLGTLHEVSLERPVDRACPSRWAAEASESHRQAVASLMAFAAPIGAILHGDPLGRYRSVGLDPSDLSQWAAHRGGAFATVTDPTAGVYTSQQASDVVNARLLARDMTPERLHELLRGDGAGVVPFIRYLTTIRSDRAARTAFLDGLGPKGFAALLAAAAHVFDRCHQTLGPELDAAARADDVLGGLGGLWATSRAEGAHRANGWTDAAFEGSLTAAGRLLEIAAESPGALPTYELAKWAGSTWHHLLAAFGTAEAPWPNLAGDHVVGALTHDGRAARSFLLGLVDDGDALGAVLANVITSPTATGRLLLASSDPTTVQSPRDDDEVARSMQAVLRTVGRLLDRRVATFPHISNDGQVDTTGYGRTLPTDLGLYAGRYTDRLIDPCDGARTGACPITSDAWPGWGEREVSRLLGRLVRDPRAAAQLQEATIAGFVRRLGALDLTSEQSDRAIEQAAFDAAAVRALVRDRRLERTIEDEHRFGQLVAAADLVVTVAGMTGPAPVVAASETWAWSSRADGATGLPTPGELVLSPFRPQSVRDALSKSRAQQALDTAVLKGVTAAIGLAQLQRAGRLVGPVPTIAMTPTAQVEQLVGANRPGDNANAAGDAYLDEVERWLDEHRDTPEGQVVERLVDSVGDAAALGSSWVS